MTTIDNIMVLADSYAAVSAVSTMAHAVEVRAELVTALTQQVKELEQDRDEWKDSTISANANAANEEKRRRAMQDERDTLRQQLAESQSEVARLEPLQFRQAPCHKFCESTAFEIEIRNLKRKLSEAQALIETSRKQKPVAYRVWRSGDDYELFFNKHSARIRGSSYLPIHEVQNLYAAPVVAPDVLKDAEHCLWARNGHAPCSAAVIAPDVLKDAQRYRYLFAGSKVYSQFVRAYEGWDGSGGNDGFDAAIDAAMGGAA